MFITLLKYLIFSAAAILVIYLLFKPKPKVKKARLELPSPSNLPEDKLYDIQPTFPVKASLHINYTDRNGEETERTVDVWEVGAGVMDNTLFGRCQLRNAMRTFCLHRIKSCFDIETGEVVGDVYKYLRNKYEQSPNYKMSEFLNNQYDALRILLYVSKADGYLRAPEREIIRATCRSLVNDSRITDKMIDNMFKDINLMTEPSFKLTVERLANSPTEIQTTILDAAKRMVATEKKIHPAEQVALDYLEKKLSS